MTFDCHTAIRMRRQALLRRYGGRAPRYTSYPTAVQFTPEVDAETYAGWLGRLPADEPVSLYAHIPFCSRLCWYCGCNTRAVSRGSAVSDYTALLEKEIQLVGRAAPARLAAAALHLGGGTPNMLTPDDLDRLFGALRQAFDIRPDAEIAAEIDPAVLTPAWVQAAAAHGLTRASLGVQDLSPHVQKAVNRIEPFDVVAVAAERLRRAGVASINLDLMYGLPRQRTDDVIATIEQVLTLSPERLAIFGYAHVPWMKPHQKLIDPADLPGDAERLEQSEAAAARLLAAGYVRIGLDHFARPDDPLAQASRSGRLRRNFQGYTTDQAPTLLGFGASGIGALPDGYVQNQSDEVGWRRLVGSGRLATARGVRVTAEDRLRGRIIERLMCDLRVDLDTAAGRELDLGDERTALEAFAADGIVEIHGGVVAVTELGRPFVRSVCAVFDPTSGAVAQRYSRAV